MANESPSVSEHVDEYHREAVKLAELVKEVADAYNAGKLNSAVSIASLSHYNLSHLQEARTGVIEALEAQGAKVGNLDE